MESLAVVVCVAFDHRASVQGLAKFKDCIIHCPLVDNVMEVTGTFDMIALGRCSSLSQFTEHMALIRPQIAEFAVRMEVNIVTSSVGCHAENEECESLWVTCDHGRKKIEQRAINKIIAEGDYMRIHLEDWNCLVHGTMSSWCDKLSATSFVRLNRSTLVRVAFLQRLAHSGRRWRAFLGDGSSVSIAKSHVHEVLQLTCAHSSNHRIGSPLEDAATETDEMVNENLMNLVA